jgi:uncharacterized protein
MPPTSTRRDETVTDDDSSTKSSRPVRLGRCPICRQPSVVRYRPFCSRRCADVDLARWLGGRYAIAGGNVDEDEDGDDARAAEALRRDGDDETLH